MPSRKRLVLVGSFVLIGATTVLAVRLAHTRRGPSLRIGALVAEAPNTGHELSRSVREGLALAKRDLESEKDGEPLEVVERDTAASAVTASEKIDELAREGVHFVVDAVGE